jgi:hypothetical protein
MHSLTRASHAGFSCRPKRRRDRSRRWLLGGGTLITLQQSGLALGVATLGTLFLALEPHGVSHAFAAAIGTQLAIVLILILATRALPLFTPTSNEEVIADA